MVQSIVSKELIGRDMLELAFRFRVEAAHPDVADAVTVHGVLLNPVCQEELYNPWTGCVHQSKLELYSDASAHRP